MKISKWISQSSILEVLDLKDLSVKTLYKSLDHLEDLSFSKIENAIYEYWKKIAKDDTESFVLDVTNTYYYGKHDKSSLRKGKDGKV